MALKSCLVDWIQQDSVIVVAPEASFIFFFSKEAKPTSHLSEKWCSSTSQSFSANPTLHVCQVSMPRRHVLHLCPGMSGLFSLITWGEGDPNHPSTFTAGNNSAENSQHAWMWVKHESSQCTHLTKVKRRAGRQLSIPAQNSTLEY